MRHRLREIAKVLTGLVVADLISVIWLSAAGFFPLTMLGVTWTSAAIAPVVVLDLSLIILLVHFGWNTKMPVRSPSERGLLLIAGTVFLIVALTHLTRIAFGWGLILGEFDIPNWLSWFGVALTAYLSYSSFHFANRTRH